MSSAASFRIEKDLLGTLEVPADAYYGIQTLRAVNNFRLSGMYTLNASEFHVNVGHAGKWSKVADSSATQWTLGYNYNLSKRTKVYTYYTKVNNKKGASYHDNVQNNGDDFSSFALGVRHNF